MLMSLLVHLQALSNESARPRERNVARRTLNHPNIVRPPFRRLLPLHHDQEI